MNDWMLLYIKNQFVARLAQLEPLIVQYNEYGSIIEKPPLLSNTKQLVLCTHDESTLSANDS